MGNMQVGLSGDDLPETRLEGDDDQFSASRRFILPVREKRLGLPVGRRSFEEWGYEVQAN